jgi:geranylgeranyl pyrophosphate synthase
LLNASTGLLTLALSTLDGDAATALTSAVRTAATGQDADLAGDGFSISERTCLEIATAKSANLLGCAARLGAQAGGAPPKLTTLYGRFAHHLGLAGQFANDLRAADLSGIHSDLVRRKPTVLLAAAGPPAVETDDPAVLRDHLYASGAVGYVWLLAEAERHHALATLDALAKRGQAVERLRHLVRPFPLQPAMESGT